MYLLHACPTVQRLYQGCLYPSVGVCNVGCEPNNQININYANHCELVINWWTALFHLIEYHNQCWHKKDGQH